MSDLLHPGALNPVDQADDAVANGLYGLSVVDGRITGLAAAEADAAAPTITYAQLSKTHTIGRNNTSSGTWNFFSWMVAHHKYLKLYSFASDVFQTDTYTLSIDGLDVGSAASTGGAAPYALTITPATPVVLTPGPHLFRLRGTAARRYYYNAANGTVPSGTYTSGLVVTQSFEGDAATAFPGTLTFDAEGVPT